MHFETNEIICVTDEQLLSEPYYRRLWISLKAVSENVSRRQWLDAISDSLRDCKADILHADGEPYIIPLPDDVFDEEMRWIGEYLKSDPTGENPLIKSRSFERLRLLDVFLKIQYPDIGQHLDK